MLPEFSGKCQLEKTKIRKDRFLMFIIALSVGGGSYHLVEAEYKSEGYKSKDIGL